MAKDNMQVDQAQSMAGLTMAGLTMQEQNPFARKPEVYANEVQVTRTEHDATLLFYRRIARPDGSGTTGKLIATITVPLGVLDGLTTKEQ